MREVLDVAGSRGLKKKKIIKKGRKKNYYKRFIDDDFDKMTRKRMRDRDRDGKG